MSNQKKRKSKDNIKKVDFRQGDRKIDVDLVPEDFDTIQCGGCNGLTFYVKIEIKGPTPMFTALVCRRCAGEIPLDGTMAPKYNEGATPIDGGKSLLDS